MDNNYFSDTSTCDEEPGERLDPLGAPNDEEDIPECFSNIKEPSLEKLKCLEEEQEILNSALFALTTHFAQVQFRLRQISNTPPEEREALLNSLEDFAAKGIPDVHLFRENNDNSELRQNVHRNRFIQKDQIRKLKRILEELQFYINIIEKDGELDEETVKIKSKLNEEYYKYVNANKRNYLETEVVNNELLIEQLKMQVNDLEGFIDFLKNQPKVNKCVCSKFTYSVKNESKTGSLSKLSQEIMFLFQFLAVFQMRCTSHIFTRRLIQNTIKSRHWGDLRAKLEVAICHVLDLVKHENRNYNKYKKESYRIFCNKELTKAVRNELSPCIRDLMEHGTKRPANVYLLPWSHCFKSYISSKCTKMDAWEIILKHCQLKNRKNETKCTSKRLAESFNLNINGVLCNTNIKTNMLQTIERIVDSHNKYKKSNDLQFKAFISEALNRKKLVKWLRLIFESNYIIKQYYQSWSYVVSTGFQDCLDSLDALTNYDFNLPADLAIFTLENINEAF